VYARHRSANESLQPTGKAWTSDYGDPEDPNDFDFIYPYSPLHNVPTDRILPPTILLTADRKFFGSALSLFGDSVDVIVR
jgi:hypothetical protein